MSESNICIREIHNIGRDTREWIVHATHCAPLSHYEIAMAGLTEASPEFEFRRPRPSVPQILACLEGEGEVLIGGRWQACGSGEAYITPPDRGHAYRAKPGARWRLAWVMYQTARSLPPAIPLDRPILVSGSFQGLGGAIQALYDEEMGPADHGILFSLASLVHAYALRTFVPRTRLAGLWDALRDDLGHRWTVPEMADRAHVSAEHLRRLSESEVGESPMRYLTRLRMREAASLLFSESYKMQEVAERVGYDNVFAFSTAFKRCFGQSPSGYRDGKGAARK